MGWRWRPAGCNWEQPPISSTRIDSRRNGKIGGCSQTLSRDPSAHGIPSPLWGEGINVIPALWLAISGSCGHCEEPEATRQSPSTEAAEQGDCFAGIAGPAPAGIPWHQRSSLTAMMMIMSHPIAKRGKRIFTRLIVPCTIECSTRDPKKPQAQYAWMESACPMAQM
jgi:hypothetical protein